MNTRRVNLFWMLMALSMAVVAAGTFEEFLRALAVQESSMNPTMVNPYKYVGLFQMGEAALQDAGYYKGDNTPKTNDWTGAFTGKNGINSLADLKANPDAQVAAVVAFENAQWKQIQALGLDNAIGQTINGVLITKSGLLAGAHLVGVGGLQKFINSNGAVVPVDGNGTAISQYISQFGGYTISSVPPTYAAVLAATGGSGFGAAPPPPSTSTTVLGSKASSVSPSTAFALGTGGYSPTQVRDMVTGTVATLMLTWVAWTAWSQFGSWRKGNIALANMQWDILRATTVFTIAVVMLQ